MATCADDKAQRVDKRQGTRRPPTRGALTRDQACWLRAPPSQRPAGARRQPRAGLDRRPGLRRSPPAAGDHRIRRSRSRYLACGESTSTSSGAVAVNAQRRLRRERSRSRACVSAASCSSALVLPCVFGPTIEQARLQLPARLAMQRRRSRTLDRRSRGHALVRAARVVVPLGYAADGAEPSRTVLRWRVASGRLSVATAESTCRAPTIRVATVRPPASTSVDLPHRSRSSVQGDPQPRAPAPCCQRKR